MAQFYSRFDPSSTSTSQPAETGIPNSATRKRKLNEKEAAVERGSKKARKDNQQSRSTSSASAQNDRREPKSDLQSGESQNGANNVENGNLESIVKTKKKFKKSRDDQSSAPTESKERLLAADKKENGVKKTEKQELRSETKGKAKKDKKTKKVEQLGSDSAYTGDAESDQHKSIRSKFKKAVEKPRAGVSGSKNAIEETQREVLPVNEIHSLEPLPRPAEIVQPIEKPTYSSLPPWLAKPLRVDSALSAKFDDLISDSTLLGNVTKQGLQTAFPAQSSVIPLLTKGTQRHEGDICISAATGSGKTLAYLLPMIQELKGFATTELRGLVVVPTRELVKQARENAELCIPGTGLKIATAVGSKNLADEQELLVERSEIYDDREYEKEQDSLIDWGKFDLQNLLSTLESEVELPENFVTKYRSAIDILICTPGRLVEHIRSTKGFSLDHVRWLVIDEADRLLNESFQEWTEVVMPALESRAAYASADKILRGMRLETVPRVIQKVVLSATMTRDVSQLSSLKLRNPKLVTVGGQPHASATNAGSTSAPEQPANEENTFNLPASLSEFVLPAGDGSEKPLILLELLRTKIDVFDLQKAQSSDDSDDSDGHNSSSSSSDAESQYSPSSAKKKSSSNLHSEPRPQSSDPPSAGNTALIFTRSTEAATRLSRLLSLLSAPISHITGTITKSSTSSSNRKTLTNFRQGKIRILIATDRASRGLDLPGLGHVISYDVPTSMTTYVHRVGRTARAGKTGTAWTMLVHREARWFWNEIGKADGEAGKIVRSGKIQKVNIKLDKATAEETRQRYEKALKTLGEEVTEGSKAAAE